MLAPRRTSLDRLPLLLVVVLAASLVAWALLGAPRQNVVLAGMEGVQPEAASEGALPAMRPSDVPGLSNEPSDLVGELLSLSLGRTESGRTPAALEPQDADPTEPAAFGSGGPVSVRSSVQAELRRARGELRNGLPEGPWVLLHPDGETLAEGRFAGGLPDGPWTWWNEDGSVHLQGEFDSGLAVGDWRGWYPDGTPSLETAYEHGEQEGPRNEWTSEGRLTLEGSHQGGLRNGLWTTYYEDGTARSRGEYQNGLRDGRWSQWHPDGTLMMKGSYLRGRRDGSWTEWYSNGQLKEGGDFVDGRREGWWDFFLFDGSPDRRTGTYTNGRRQRG